ncbi:MAG TPA: DUF6036 family nucleotidyltransferase [Fibrobacteria bacterium]|nr:DUF6036 family nucleotidyltransferase [Fibrobacteria bacterium]
MKFEQLCHLIRAATAISEETEFVVIGSQSILGSWPDAPAELLVSEEIDAWPRHRPDLADLLDGSIGELSPFHETFGYYLQGVGPETAVLAPGWQDRLVRVSHPSMGGGVALCLDPVDLLAAKCAAGREKDLAFVQVALRSGRISTTTVESRIMELDASPEVRHAASMLLRRAA